MEATTALQRTLLLDCGFQPIKILSWEHAIALVYLGKAEVVASYDDVVRSPSVTIHKPAVARLTKGFKRHRKAVKFSRINIYARDEYKCGYCGTKLKASGLTYDHVLPRAQGGKTVWTNIVSCCVPCNLRKGGRTPEQAGMKLLKQPTQPTSMPATTLQLSAKSIPAAWRDFVYWTGALVEE